MAIGEVSVPTELVGAGDSREQRPNQHCLVLQLPAAATPPQVVVAHQQPAWPHHELIKLAP